MTLFCDDEVCAQQKVCEQHAFCCISQCVKVEFCGGWQVRDHDVRLLLRGVAECIQHSPSEEQRAECCAALVTIYSTAKYRTSGMEELTLQEVVVTVLAAALADKSPAVSKSAMHALEAVRTRASDAFMAAVETLPADLQKLVKSKKRSSVAVVEEQTDTVGEITHDLGVAAESQESGGSEAGGLGGMSLSFVPPRLLEDLQDANNWRVRALAVEELQGLVKAVHGPAEIQPHLAQLMDFLLALLHDPNFKIEITALQTIGDLISLMGADIRPFEVLLMPQLQQKLGDNKTLVRHANAKVVVKMMGALGPDGIVSALLGDLSHESWRVREEILVLTMQGLLAFEPRLNLDAIVCAVAPLLDDEKIKVKLTAIESLALLHAAMGADRFFSVLPTLDGHVLRLLEVRLTQPQLPTLNAEGMLELPTVRGNGHDDTSSTSGAGTPHGTSRTGDRGGDQEPSRSPMRRDRLRPHAGDGERDEMALEREQVGTASPSRRADRGGQAPSPMRFTGAAMERTDSPRSGRRGGEDGVGSPRVGPMGLGSRRGSQQNLEDLGALLAADDQPLYSEVTVDDRAASRGSMCGMLRSPRRMATGADSSGRGTPRNGGALEQVPENTEDTRSRRQYPTNDSPMYEESSTHDIFEHIQKPIKPFWMDGLRTDVGSSDGRDSFNRVGHAMGGAISGAMNGTISGAMCTMGTADQLRGDATQFIRGASGPRMRPPSAGRRAAQGAGGLNGMPHDTDVYNGQSGCQNGPQGGIHMVGAWGCGVEDTRFESLLGFANSSPMVCSPPMSPQSVRACVSPSSHMRLLNSHSAHHLPAQSLKGTFNANSNVPTLEKAHSEHIMREPPASVPTRTAGGMGSAMLGLDPDELSLSKDKIASRLSIIKTRRGRTSSSRRVPNSMSAPADESAAFGLGDTRPGSSLFASTSADDLRQPDIPSDSGGGGRERSGGGGGGGVYRPSQSAPSSVSAKGHGAVSDRDREREERDRVQLEKERSAMEVEGAPPGAHRSVMDISAKPIELLVGCVCICVCLCACVCV